MTSTPAIPASPPPIRAHRLSGRAPAFVTDAPPPPAWTDVHEQAWRRLCALNPRLHDGPIWAVARASAASLTIHPGRYKQLAVQADAAIGDTGVRLLGVKGLMVATDRAGHQRVLLARRGPRVGVYPRLWETAPAGGVAAGEPPSAQVVLGALLAEGREELGVDAASAAPRARFLAVIEDDLAHSVDLLVRLSWPGAAPETWSLPPAREARWEYAESRWITTDDARDLLAHASSAAELTPPTRWVLEHLPELLSL
jgi:hypothetical protein